MNSEPQSAMPTIQNSELPPILSPEDNYEDITIKIPDSATGVISLSESPNSIYHYFVASPLYAGFGDLTNPKRLSLIESLPKMSRGLKDYFTSSATVELIFSTGKEYDLEDGQISEIGIVVRELLIGNIFIKDFPMTLSSKLGIDDIKAGEIANKLISQSFGPIIEDLKRIQRSKFPDKISQLQKESMPDKMTQATAKPVQPRESLTPAQKLTQPETRPPSPPTPSVPPISSFRSPAPEEMKAKPVEQNKSFSQSPEPASQSNRPLTQPMARPDALRPSSMGAATNPATPEPIRPAPLKSPLPPPPDLRADMDKFKDIPTVGPQSKFRAPDLTTVPSGLPQNQDKKMGGTDKSLEDELEKVANVIDLRSKENSQ